MRNRIQSIQRGLTVAGDSSSLDVGTHNPDSLNLPSPPPPHQRLTEVSEGAFCSGSDAPQDIVDGTQPP